MEHLSFNLNFEKIRKRFLQMSEQEKVTSKKKSPIALVIGLVVALGAAGFFFYQKSVTEDKLAKSEAQIIIEQQKVDDLTADLDSKVSEIDNLIAERMQLGAEIDDLMSERDELVKDRDKLKVQASAAARDIKKLKKLYATLEAKNKDYEKTVEDQKTEIASLVAQKDSLITVSDSLNQMSENQKMLIDGQNARLENGSKLDAENILISYKDIKMKSKDKQPFSAKKLHMLIVDFNIGKNYTASHRKKQIAIRIVDAEGATVYDEGNGGGTITTPKGESINYTQKQNLLFDNSKQRMTFPYTRNGDWTAGEYTVTVYGDGQEIGSAKFSVK